MYKTIILNANWFFRVVWSFIKSFLDENTSNKVEIWGESDMKNLLKEIDRNRLEKKYGGSMANLKKWCGLVGKCVI